MKPWEEVSTVKPWEEASTYATQADVLGKRNIIPNAPPLPSLNVQPSIGEKGGALAAFLRPFHETATLGASSKIIPAFEGEGKTYGERKEHYGKMSKAFEEAHPIASALGNIAGFAKGPGKKALSPALDLATKVEKALVKKIPGIPKAIATGLGFGATEGIKETVKEESIKKGIEKGAGTAVTTSIGVPLVKGASKLVGKAYKALAYKAGGIGSGQGPSKEAFEAYVSNPEKVSKAAGTQQDIVDRLTNLVVSRNKLPESLAAEKLIPKIPKINTDKIIGSFKKFTSEEAMSPEDEVVLKNLGKWKKHLDKIKNQITLIEPKFVDKIDPPFPKGVKAPTTEDKEIYDFVYREGRSAELINKFKKSIQSVIDDKYGSDNSSSYFKRLKELAYEARQAIEEASLKNPETAEYPNIMKKLSEKMRAFSNLNKLLGSDIGSKAATALGKIESITNRGFSNKRFVVRLKDFDKKFGTNFYDESLYAKYAKELGPSGKPSFLPYWKTGGWALPVGLTSIPSLLGALGSTVGSAGALAVPGALISSPRVTSSVLRAGAKIGTSQPMLYKKAISDASEETKNAIKRKLEEK